MSNYLNAVNNFGKETIGGEYSPGTIDRMFPGSGDDVFIPTGHVVHVPEDVSIVSLTVGEESELSIRSGKTLVLSGAITNNGVIKTAYDNSVSRVDAETTLVGSGEAFLRNVTSTGEVWLVNGAEHTIQGEGEISANFSKASCDRSWRPLHK